MFHYFPLQLITDHNQHSVSFTLNRGHAIIVQYDHDDDTDMYQIGRSSESPIDFVVMDTVPGAQRAEDCVVTQSTISRFACRILVDRNPPHTARIYAAGFDSGRNIFLGVSNPFTIPHACRQKYDKVYSCKGHCSLKIEDMTLRDMTEVSGDQKFPGLFILFS